MVLPGRVVRLFALILMVAYGSAAWGQQQTQVIEDVRLVGNRRIPEDTIRFYIQTKKGDQYNEDRLRLDHRGLWNTNFFSDVQVLVEEGKTGPIVIFRVAERPLIRSITYEGIKSFKESDILEKLKERKVGLSVDSAFDEAKLPQARRVIEDLLKQNGRPLGAVTFEVEPITQSAVKITFKIDEGAKVRIGDIQFEGNTVFPDGKLRDDLKLTKERGLIPIFKGTDKYQEEKLEYDANVNLMDLYRENGYINARIGTPSVEIKEGPRGMTPLFRKTKQQFYIRIPIQEGEQYRFSSFDMTGVQQFKKEDIMRLFGFKPGDLVNIKRWRKQTEELTKLYESRGYLDMEAIPEFNPDNEKKTVALTITVNEGRAYVVNRIDFSGNTKTKDKVMRREMFLEEQQIFNGKLLELSVVRLNQLGFFQKVEERDYEVNKNPQTGEVNVTVNVKEQSQQSIGLTGGVSGISGSFIGVNYTTNNFRGLGQRIEVDILTGTRTTNFTFAFTEPYFRDTKVSLGFSVFNQRLRFDTFSTFLTLNPSDNIQLFTQHSTGFTLTGSYPIRNFTRLGLGYSLQNISIADIDSRFQNFALNQFIFTAPGGEEERALKGIIRSELTPTYVVNTKNAFFNASAGSSFTVSVPIAGGPLGGDFDIIKPSLEYQKFWCIKNCGSGGRYHVIAFRGFLETVLPYAKTPGVPFFERLFSGGENLLRGFDIRSVSPFAILSTPAVDSNGSPVINPNTGLPLIQTNLTPVGGDSLVNLTAEYRIPIVGPLGLAAFIDVGNSSVLQKNKLGVFGKTTTLSLLSGTNNVIRSSVGAEIQFLLPVINAPFRLIFAYNPLILDTTTIINGVQVPLREQRKGIRFTIGQTF
ncbi:MAG: outer membrane protein assembly factor BamA [Acidobacteria bacterium]|nr:outer membrane protein assembly factor BamA [Acidobacteriota bacterium]